MGRRQIVGIIAAVLSLFFSSFSAQAEEVPLGFNLIGTYQAEEYAKVRSGEYLIRPSAALIYRVYSNGAELKVFTDNVVEHQTFEVYRSDGIATDTTTGDTQIVPGIQARSTSGSSLKQLTLTKNKLTVTSFPPLSSEILIMRAQVMIPRAEPIIE